MDFQSSFSECAHQPKSRRSFHPYPAAPSEKCILYISQGEFAIQYPSKTCQDCLFVAPIFCLDPTWAQQKSLPMTKVGTETQSKAIREKGREKKFRWLFKSERAMRRNELKPDMSSLYPFQLPLTYSLCPLMGTNVSITHIHANDINKYQYGLEHHWCLQCLFTSTFKILFGTPCIRLVAFVVSEPETLFVDVRKKGLKKKRSKSDLLYSMVSLSLAAAAQKMVHMHKHSYVHNWLSFKYIHGCCKYEKILFFSSMLL